MLTGEKGTKGRLVLLILNEPRYEKTNDLVSDLVRHKPGCTTTETARGLKFWIKGEEGLYYPCSENKGADQLRGYREADLRLCFRICKMLVFL